MDDYFLRYQVGGDIYETLAAKYGTAGADRVANAAATGDRVAITNALAVVKNGAALDTSTLSIFTGQIVNDPLAAPAESLNNQIGKAFGNVFGKPWIVLALLLVGALAWFYFVGNPFKKK